MDTFGQWLIRQYMMPGAVGELAYDASIDPWFPVTSKHRETYRDYLWERGATPRMKAAFDKAWEIWLSQQGRD